MKLLRFSLFLAAFCGSLLWAERRMTPNAPIGRFRMPMFAESGYKVWDLRGEKGIYLDETQIAVKEMQLVVFNGQKVLEEELDIRSPKALMMIRENRAKGPTSPIEIRGKEYILTGKNWEWDGLSKRVVVNEDVSVKFEQSLGDLMNEDDL